MGLIELDCRFIQYGAHDFCSFGLVEIAPMKAPMQALAQLSCFSIDTAKIDICISQKMRLVVATKLSLPRMYTPLLGSHPPRSSCPMDRNPQLGLGIRTLP